MVKKKYMKNYPEVYDAPDWKCSICNKNISWGVRSIASHYACLYIENKEDGEIFEDNDARAIVDDDEIMLEGLPKDPNTGFSTGSNCGV